MIHKNNKISDRFKNTTQKVKNFWNSLTKKRKFFYGISLFLLCFAFIFPGFVQATLLDAVLKLLSNVLQIVAYGLGWIATKLMVALIFFATWGKYTKGITAVEEGWIIARDVCNMFFIFILLIISFATIIGIESYSYKKWLAKIIIFAILINFSKMITGLLIDVSQIVMLTFVSGFRDATVNNFATGLHLDQLMSKNSQGDVRENSGGTFNIFIVMLLVCIMMIVLNVILVIMIVMLVGRILSLWVLAILSPFAFLLQASPVGGKYANEWWQSLSKNLISGPILAMFIYLAMYTIQSSVDVTTTSGTTQKSLSAMGGATIQADQTSMEIGDTSGTQEAFKIQDTSMILDFIIVIAMMIAAIRIAGSLGVMGSNFANNMSNKLQNAGKSALKLGAAGIGAATGANYLAKRYKAYKEIRKDRKDQKAYQDAQTFMDRTGKIKQGVGKFMQNPLKAMSSDKNKVGRAFKGADNWVQNAKKTIVSKTGIDKLNFAQKARERAEQRAKTASDLSYARSMGIRSEDDVDNINNGLRDRETDLNNRQDDFLNQYRAQHPGANITDINQIDKGTLNDEQRSELASLTNDRERINKEKEHIKGIKGLFGGDRLDRQEAEFINDYINHTGANDITDINQIDRNTLNNRQRRRLDDLASQRTEFNNNRNNGSLGILEDLSEVHNINNRIKNKKFDRLDRQEEEFINDYRNRTGANITDISQIDRTTLDNKQRQKLDNIQSKRASLGVKESDINNFEDVLNNTRVLDETVNHFQQKSEASSRAAQGWTEFGTGAAAVFRRALMGASFLAPFASALGTSFFAPLANLYGITGSTGGVLASSAASWTMAGVAAPGLTRDAGKAIERSGGADIRDAANFLSNKVMDAAKKFEDMDTGMIERMRDDIRTSNVDYMAAQFQLLKRGLVNVDQIPQLLSDLQNRGADRNTLRAFEGEIRKQFPTEGRWLDTSGQPLTDGDRGIRQAEIMRHQGSVRVLEGINATGYTQETIRNAIRTARTPGELRGVDRLSQEQQRGIAETSQRVLLSDANDMSIEDLNKANQIYSRTASSYSDVNERHRSTKEVYDALVNRNGGADIENINFGELLANMNLDAHSATNQNGLRDQEVDRLLASVNPVELTNAVRNANELGGEQKIMMDRFLARIHPVIQTGVSAGDRNAVDIYNRLKQMSNNATLNTLRNLQLYT